MVNCFQIWICFHKVWWLTHLLGFAILCALHAKSLCPTIKLMHFVCFRGYCGYKDGWMLNSVVLPKFLKPYDLWTQSQCDQRAWHSMFTLFSFRDKDRDLLLWFCLVLTTGRGSSTPPGTTLPSGIPKFHDGSIDRVGILCIVCTVHTVHIVWKLGGCSA